MEFVRGFLLFITIIVFQIDGLLGQDNPIFLPEDIQPVGTKEVCFCKPGLANTSRSRGVELTYVQFGNTTFQEEEGFPLFGELSEFKLQQINFRLRYPLVNKDGLKVIAGISYRPERYNFNLIGTDYQSVFEFLDNRTLKSSGLGLIVSKSLNEKYYSILSLRTRFNGNYDGLISINDRYAIYQVAAIFGIKKGSDREFAFGLNLSHSFRNTTVIPFLIYNQTFNKKWGIESVLPSNIKVRYNISTESLIYFDLRFNSQSFALDTNEQLAYDFNLNHSELRSAVTFEKKLFSWIWLDLTGGVQYNFTSDFDAVDGGPTSFQIEPGFGPYFKVGFFVSPPDSYVK